MATFSSGAFDTRVTQTALEFSRLRKVDLLVHPGTLDAIPSTQEEAERDWSAATAYWVRFLMVGPINFSLLDESCLDRLALSWLDDAKEFGSYCMWRERWHTRGVWSTDDAKRENYHDACAQIHDWLVSQENKRDRREFDLVRRYIEQRLLDKGKVELGRPHVGVLIKRKAERMWQVTRDSYELRNWLPAKGYVQSFYENIIPAVDGKGDKYVENVLMALQDHHNTNRRSLLVNGLEAAVAIRFLDPITISSFERATGANVF
jgi:hypothetical protein